MSGKNRIAITVILLAGSFTISETVALAQAGQSPAGQQPAATSKDQKPADAGSTLEIPVAQPPVNAEEDAAAEVAEVAGDAALATGTDTATGLVVAACLA